MPIFWREHSCGEIALIIALDIDEREIAHIYRTPNDDWVGLFADHETEHFEDLQEAKRDLLGLIRQVSQLIHDKVKQNQTELGNE